MENQVDIQASEEEKYEFVIKIAEGRLNFEEIKSWIEKRLIKK